MLLFAATLRANSELKVLTSSSIMPIEFLGSQLLAQASRAQQASLLVGIAICVGGVLLMFSHRRSLDEAFEESLSGQKINFENRKYRRRVVVAGMIASLGVMISAIYWVEEPRAFAILIVLILGTLVAILGVAMIDLYSVGLQTLASTDQPDRKELIEDYLKRRQQAAAEAKSSNEE